MSNFYPALFENSQIPLSNRLAIGHVYSVHLMSAPIHLKHARLIKDTSKPYFTHIRFFVYVNSEENVWGYADRDLKNPIGVFPLSHCLRIEDYTPDVSLTAEEAQKILSTAPTEKVTFDFSNLSTTIEMKKETTPVVEKDEKVELINVDELEQMTLF